MYVDNHGRDNLSEFAQINESKALITNIPTIIITKMIEKPKIPEFNLAITGIYFLTPKIFQKIKNYFLVKVQK